MNEAFVLGVVFILMHEMDAVRCREWRIFPGLSLLDERRGTILFIFLHMPLYYGLIAAISIGNRDFVKGFDIFLIVHLVLHIGFLRHKNNEFKDWISWSIIIGAGICGATDLWLYS